VVNVHSSVYAWTKDAIASGASQHIWRDRLYLPLLHRYEQRYGQKFSELVVTTPDDGRVLRQLCPNTPITTIPNGVDLTKFPMRDRDPGGHRLIYVGAMDASHNIDAARYFALKIFPAVRQRYTDAEFVIAGARPASAILTLNQCPGVTVMGAVPQMATALHNATVCVVPLRTGLGIKNKTLEAMAAGVPVVGSDRALEGLRVNSETNLPRALRANHPEEYIKAISRLFEQPELRQQISVQARQYVEHEFTWEQAGQTYESVLTRLTQRRA
jgi:polysaccharide biosynthesis protein PslH